MKIGICPKCGESKELSKHHLRPKRFYKGSPVVHICRTCHDELEMVILNHEKIGRQRIKLDAEVYEIIFYDFIGA